MSARFSKYLGKRCELPMYVSREQKVLTLHIWPWGIFFHFSNLSLIYATFDVDGWNWLAGCGLIISNLDTIVKKFFYKKSCSRKIVNFFIFSFRIFAYELDLLKAEVIRPGKSTKSGSEPSKGSTCIQKCEK